MNPKESTTYIVGSSDETSHYWQDLAVANRRVAEDAQSQRDAAVAERDKLAEVFRQYRKDHCGCMIKECPDCFKECGK